MASTPTYFRVCLLKTAIAQVSSPTVTTEIEGNILFDEGAQRSFITQALAKELQLQPTHRENISVSSFGAQVSSSRNMEVASVFIHTLSGSRISISVLIVSQLAAPIQNAVITCLRDIPYLQGLPLAHPVTGDENFDSLVQITTGNSYKTTSFGEMDQQPSSHILAISCLDHFLYLNLLKLPTSMLQSSHAQLTVQIHAALGIQNSQIPCPVQIQ